MKNQFINCCIKHKTTDKNKINKIKEKIQVINFSENNTYFLGFESKKIAQILNKTGCSTNLNNLLSHFQLVKHVIQGIGISLSKKTNFYALIIIN